jgi:hypothetical protein
MVSGRAERRKQQVNRERSKQDWDGPAATYVRSVAAVLAGIVVGVPLTIATDLVLHMTGVFPPWGQPMINADGILLLATAYRVVYGVAGSYITARISPDRPMQHALVGGAIGLVVCIVGAVVTWNGGPAFGPTGIRSRTQVSLKF